MSTKNKASEKQLAALAKARAAKEAKRQRLAAILKPAVSKPTQTEQRQVQVVKKPASILAIDSEQERARRRAALKPGEKQRLLDISESFTTYADTGKIKSEEVKLALEKIYPADIATDSKARIAFFAQRDKVLRKVWGIETMPNPGLYAAAIREEKTRAAHAWIKKLLVNKPPVYEVKRLSFAATVPIEADIEKIRYTGEDTNEPVNNKSLDVRDELNTQVLPLSQGTNTYDLFLNENLPRNYPYYVKSEVYLTRISGDEVTGDNEVSYTQASGKKYMLIGDNVSRKRYIEIAITSIFDDSYGILSDMAAYHVNRIDLRIARPSGKQKVISVAQSMEAGNCMIRILQNNGCNDMNKVFAKFPHLKPALNEATGAYNPIYINPDEIAVVAKLLRRKINVYTPLGRITGDVWESFGHIKDKILPVQFSMGHATLISENLQVDSVMYVDKVVVPMSPDVVAYDTYNHIDNAKYYIKAVTVTIKKKNTTAYVMVKSFKPSTVTGDLTHDNEPAFHYVFDKNQLLFKFFKKDFKIKCIDNTDIRNCVRSSEHFVGRALLMPVTDNVVELDHNKNYCSYKSCGYYRGFPTEVIIPTTTKPVLQPDGLSLAFVKCSRIRSFPKYFDLFLKYKQGKICIPAPVYYYLLDHGAIIDVDMYFVSRHIDIDMVGYFDHFRELGWVDADEMKLARNCAIGMTITGGTEEKGCARFGVGEESELNQVIGECHKNGFTFDVQDHPCGNKVVEINYKKRTRGCFQFHSYILGYALIHMLKKINQLENAGCTIYGWNTDSILYEGDWREYSTDIGGWKMADVNPIYRYWSNINPGGIQLVQSNVDFGINGKFREPIIGHTVFTGAAGVGKSHTWKEDPLFDQIMLTPTKSLRDEHKNGKVAFLNTYTVHKYVQFGIQQDDRITGMRTCGKIPSQHMYIVIDELSMFTREQWRTIMRRCQNSIIIALGDFEQICNEVGSKESGVDLEFFKGLGFTHHEIARTPESVSRHSYEDGKVLDSLRGKKIPEQIRALKESGKVKFVDNLSSIIESMVVNGATYITDNHRECSRVNMLAKAYFNEKKLLMPLRCKDGEIVNLDVNDDKIWWDRLKMDDVMPAGFKYEPTFAVTVDSVQGKTMHNYVCVDINVNRHGSFYTGVSRTRNLSTVIVVGQRV